MSKEPLTPEQAEAMLKQLSEHYRTPVMPVSRYCASLQAWRRAQSDRVARLRANTFLGIEGPPDDLQTQAAKDSYWAWKKSGSYGYQELRELEVELLAIDNLNRRVLKSNLLARLIYGGEKIRTRMCPKHKGVWSGMPSSNCEHGCQHTGWLPEPEAV